MSSRTGVHARLARQGLILLLVGTMVLSPVTSLNAGNFNRNGAVGGISINVDGIVKSAVLSDRAELARHMREELAVAPAGLQGAVAMRKISLRGLEEACEHYLQHNNGQLPDEVKYLGGLLRVQYVFVYPELNDIVIAGPAEGWTVDAMGNVVGATTGQPILQLDDLLVALRCVELARTEGISCSIEPTEEGYRNLNRVLQNPPTRNPAALETLMRQAFGPQQVKLTGIPENSRFARILVAADYRMKRLAMDLDEAPVQGLPSYLELTAARRSSSSSSVNPRWWMACNYEPLARSEDGLAWEMRGPGVKVLTEDDYVDGEGAVRPTGRIDATAQEWADSMNRQFEALAARDPIFAELRNLMDLCVVAAIIESNDLAARAGISLPLLTGADSSLMIDDWNAPRAIEPHFNFLRSNRGLTVMASGGVQIESWEVAQQSQVQEHTREAWQDAMAPAGSHWWWN